jgi:Zn-dependent M28 family amino/carboxypeptidase
MFFLKVISSVLIIFFGVSLPMNPVNGSGYARPPKKVSWDISERAIYQTLEEMQAFGNRTTWEKQNQVAEFIYNKLKSFKALEVGYHFYRSAGKTWKNVVARMPGKKNPEIVYVFCAHYDSHPAGWEAQRFAPGADDNGSGVAVLLEGARRLAENPADNTVEWLFFSNEEQGHKGSLAYVQDLKAKGVALKGVVNIDTIGYTQSSLTAIWRESQGQGLLTRGVYLFKQMIKKPVLFLQTGFRNPNELLLIGGRPGNAPFVEKTFAYLKGSGLGVKKDTGPQCG